MPAVRAPRVKFIVQAHLKALGARIWQQDDASALDTLEPLVLAHPKLVAGHRLLVNGSLKFGDPDRAMRALDQFVRHHPDHPDLAKLQDHVARSATTESAPQTPAETPKSAPDPNRELPDSETLFAHAMAALNRGHAHDALNFFCFAGIPRGTNPTQLNPYALALKAIGDQDGLAQLLVHVKTLPTAAGVSMLAGNVASHMGDLTQAGDWYRRAATQNPNLPQAWQRQADLLIQNGHASRAIALLSDLPETLQTHSGLCLIRARAALMTGQVTEARRLLDAIPASERTVDWGLMQARLARVALDPVRVIEACDRVLEQVSVQGAVQAIIEAEALDMRALARVQCCDTAGAWADAQAANAIYRRNGAPRLRAREGIVGGLVNEMLLDPQTTAQLALAQTGEDPIPALARETAAHPGQTAGALALLLALRGRDLQDIQTPVTTEIPVNSPVNSSDSGPVSSPDSPVPPVFYHYWEQGPIPTDLSDAIADLRAKNPWAEHVLLDQRSALAWLREHAPAPVLRAWRICRQPSDRLDLLRLAVMGTVGGIWVANNTRITADLRPLLCPDRDLILYQDPTGAPGSGFIAAAPAQPLMQQAMDEIAEAQLAGASEFAWLRTGPGALARPLAQYLADFILKTGSEPGVLPPGLSLAAPGELTAYLTPDCALDLEPKRGA